MKTQKAQLNYLNIAPRKVRLIANTLKGLSLNEAEAQLMLRPQRAAAALLKLLRSAVANAKNNASMNPEQLKISKLTVDSAPTLKRSLPRSMGRATPLLKRMSHVTLELAESEAQIVNRFTVIPKPKKEKKEEKPKRKDKKAGDVQPKPEKKDEKQKVKEAVPREHKKGVFRRFFRRKSI